MKYLLTGASGFIGSNLALDLLQQGHEILNLDKLTYAANPLDEFLTYKTYSLAHIDISELWNKSNNSEEVLQRVKKFNPDYLVHLGAETMVDRALNDNRVFFESNTLGTWAILELIKILQIKKAVFFSTDEVYGSLDLENFEISNPKFGFKPEDKLDPRNPYAGSKAAADQVTTSYIHNFNLPICLIRPANNFGEKQHLEKLIPKAITNIKNGLKVPIYSNGRFYREWTYVKDVCKAVQTIIEKGLPGKIYNVGSGERFSNLEIIDAICKGLSSYGIITTKEAVIEHVDNRLGHDVAYSVNSSAIRSLGWFPEHDLTKGLDFTIKFYLGIK